jgi:hypothetical protein
MPAGATVPTHTGCLIRQTRASLVARDASRRYKSSLPIDENRILSTTIDGEITQNREEAIK